MKRELVVPPQGVAGRRLDVFLTEKLKVSRSQIQRLLKDGAITINDQPARASYSVEAGDRVGVTWPEPIIQQPAAPPPDLPIIFEDSDLLVIDKPAGIAAHAGNGRAAESTVADFARLHTTDPDPERPGIVHRLDRDTSGLLVIAKTLDAKAYLQHLWQGRKVHKTYQLLAVGRIDPAEAIIKLPLERDPARPLRRRVSPTGKPATTRYKLLAAYPGYSLIEAHPETGRTHQIRVHFAALGHPVAGDITYGAPQRPLGLTRQFLHASQLSFRAPSGRQLDLTSPLPAELTSVLTRLEEPYN